MRPTGFEGHQAQLVAGMLRHKLATPFAQHCIRPSSNLIPNVAEITLPSTNANPAVPLLRSLAHGANTATKPLSCLQNATKHVRVAKSTHSMTLPIELPFDIYPSIFSYLLPEDAKVVFLFGTILAVKYGYPDVQDLTLPHLPSASMDAASRQGQVELLDRWKTKGSKLKPTWTESAMDGASANGHVDVLRWWKGCGWGLKWSKAAIDGASTNGHVDVLSWWKISGLPLRWSTTVIDRASADGKIAILSWWRLNGREMEAAEYAKAGGGKMYALSRHQQARLPRVIWTKEAMDNASAHGHVNILTWWRDSGWDMRWTTEAMDGASREGQIAVLDWWKDTGLPLKWTHRALDDASSRVHVAVLNWWKSSGLQMKYDFAMDYASAEGHVEILSWWKESNLPLSYGTGAMDWASQNGHVQVLQWWKCSGLALEWTTEGVDLASRNGRVDVLEWWKHSGLNVKWTEYAKTSGYRAVLDWWRANEDTLSEASVMVV